MTLIEILTIYLTVGAPLAMHFWLTRAAHSTSRLDLAWRVAGVWLGWCFAAPYLLRRRLARSATATPQTSTIDEIEAGSQKLLRLFAELDERQRAIGFFEFRELVERFIGLTCAARDSSPNAVSDGDCEFLRAAGVDLQHQKLSARILQRRHYLRLQAHQIKARQEFSRCIEQTAERIERATRTELFDLWRVAAADLLLSLDQSEARRELLERLDALVAARDNQVVADAERLHKSVWSIIPPTTAPASSPLKVLTAAMKAAPSRD